MYTKNQQVNNKIEDSRKSVVSRIWHSVVSFIIGLSAFFIFKLLVMIPLNLFTTVRNRDLMEGVGALLFIFCIYLAIKYTKYLNTQQSTKGLVIKKVITVVVGIFAMIFSTVILALSRGSAT